MAIIPGFSNAESRVSMMSINKGKRVATSRPTHLDVNIMKGLLILAILPLLIALAVAKQDEICHDGECYPRIFVPTEKFQVIKEGQEIPGGTIINAHL